MKNLSLFYLVLVIFFGCSRDKSVNNHEPIDVYSYRAYDSSGKKIIQGWFEISIMDSSQIKGTWHLHKTANVGEVGPQTGDGSLRGRVYNNSVYINLNPDFSDNNVILRGPAFDYVTEGEWSWVNFKGVVKKGTYKAIRELTCLTE